jgi:predicted nucleic acid-binding protein
LAFLFDTDAISELIRRRPARRFVSWLSSIPREDQYTSAIVVGELFKGAFRSADAERHLRNIEERILPAVTVLPLDVAVAREFGRLRAMLEEAGTPLPDADIQIAATSIHHHLTGDGESSALRAFPLPRRLDGPGGRPQETLGQAQ